jgi:hypothetical protein
LACQQQSLRSIVTLHQRQHFAFALEL